MKLSKKILSFLLVLVMAMALFTGIAEGDQVEIDIYCAVSSSKGIDPDNLWWWSYIESRLAEQGYNVKLNVTGGLAGDESEQGKALRIGSDNLPDIMFGFTLTGPEIVMHGDTAGMLLDITPYLNAEDMPNAYECSQTNGADAFASSVSPAGKIYGVPYVVDRTLGWLAGTSPNFNCVWVNTTMLEELGYEMPHTADELLEVLRAAKDYETEDGKEMIPFLATDGGYINSLIFACLGFYGADHAYGMDPGIKDGEIVLPAFTEEYKTYLEFFRTMYEEELISTEFFTMDDNTRKALAKEGNFLIYAGLLSEITDVPEVFHQYTGIAPIYFDEDVTPVASVTVPYTCNRVWASAKTEHPEEVIAILDLLYDDEAIMSYVYGPVLEDKLGILENAWVVNEAGNDLVHPQVGAERDFPTINDLQFDVIAPCGLIGDMSGYTFYAKNVVAGLDFQLTYDEYVDAVTGETVTVTNKSGYPEKYEKSVDAYYRLNRYYAWKNNLTTVRPAMLYCSEEESQRITDLKAALDSFVRENFAQFVTGGRDIEEFDAFQEELKDMGVEELLDIYQRGYAPYIESVFG